MRSFARLAGTALALLALIASCRDSVPPRANGCANGCLRGGSDAPQAVPAVASSVPAVASPVPAVASAEFEGIDSVSLLDLARWVKDHSEAHLYSLLVSRHGRLVFELYTSSIDPDAAHYLMSATKSVVSAVVGIAIGKGLIKNADVSIGEALPADVFPSASNRERFRTITLKQVLGMSALDAPDPPHVTTPEAIERQRLYLAAPNRVRFALGEPIVASPGTTFLYNNVAPNIVTGLISYASGQTALSFAEANLFAPMGFRNYEWMHQDASGIDSGGYGLRLRPVDMLKFGMLYLDGGRWGGRELVPASWVEMTLRPWIRSKPELATPDYGWFWWTRHYREWTAREAEGWKGQLIIIFPEQGMVVTMTGCMTAEESRTIPRRLVEDFIIPAVEHGRERPLVAQPAVEAALRQTLAEVRSQGTRIAPGTEARMIPTVAPKGSHRNSVVH